MPMTDNARYLIFIAHALSIIYGGLHLVAHKLRAVDLNFIPDRSKLTQPCILMDPIKLMLGDPLVSFPAKNNFRIYEAKGLPKLPRRQLEDEHLFFQVCDENKPYHFASGLQRAFGSLKNTAEGGRWCSTVYGNLALGQPNFMENINENIN